MSKTLFITLAIVGASLNIYGLAWCYTQEGTITAFMFGFSLGIIFTTCALLLPNRMFWKDKSKATVNKISRGTFRPITEDDVKEEIYLEKKPMTEKMPKIVNCGPYDYDIANKLKRFDDYVSFALYPYAHVSNVSLTNTSVYVFAESEDQIDEALRQALVNSYNGYGAENAEKGIPSVTDMKKMWRTEKEYRDRINSKAKHV